MKTPSLKVVLITLFLICICQTSLASDKTPEAELIEKELNRLFIKAMNVAAVKLDETDEVNPFAVMVKRDGSLGFFELDMKKTKKMSVNSQNLSIRRLLREVAGQDQITSTIQVMYALVKKENGEERQGLTFEIEHESGVSLLRFIPVSERIDKNDTNNNKWVLEIESISTAAKPKTIFGQSIVKKEL